MRPQNKKSPRDWPSQGLDVYTAQGEPNVNLHSQRNGSIPVPLNIVKQTSAQATVAPYPDFSANVRGASHVTGEGQRAPLNTSDLSSLGLIEIDLNIVSVRFHPWRSGLGRVIALTVAHTEYQEAVCYSGELPFAVEPGQKVRIRGRQGAYRGKTQIIFWGRDIALVAQAANNPDLVSIEAAERMLTEARHD